MYVLRIMAALAALATTLWLALHPSLLDDVAVEVAAAVVADLFLQGVRSSARKRDEPTPGSSAE